MNRSVQFRCRSDTKRFVISLSLIVLLFSTFIFNTQRVSADTTTAHKETYLEKSFEAIMTGVVAVGAAGLHFNSFVDENLDLIRDSAIDTWNGMSPVLKEEFGTAMINAGDKITVTGDIIGDFFGNMRLNNQSSSPDFLSTDINIQLIATFTNPNYPDIDGKKFINKAQLPAGYSIRITGYGSSYRYFTSTFSLSGDNRIWMNGGQFTISDENYSIAVRILTNTSAMTINDLVTLYKATYGNYAYKVELLQQDVVLDIDLGTDLPTGELDNLQHYLENDRLIFDAGLVVPKVEPTTRTGDRLFYNDATGSLVLDDGVPYTGDVTWRMPNTGVRTSTVDGVATSVPVTTATDGAIVNIRTGEIIEPAPTGTTPPKNTEKGKGKIQDFLPFALVLGLLGVLKAILYFLLRMLAYLLSLPNISARPITDYPLLTWFMEVKILGIYVYDTVITLATFFMAFVIYKAIKNAFGE